LCYRHIQWTKTSECSKLIHTANRKSEHGLLQLLTAFTSAEKLHDVSVTWQFTECASYQMTVGDRLGAIQTRNWGCCHGIEDDIATPFETFGHAEGGGGGRNFYQLRAAIVRLPWINLKNMCRTKSTGKRTEMEHTNLTARVSKAVYSKKRSTTPPQEGNS
jgi:hypothetical protein